jgi:hypothetical protein
MESSCFIFEKNVKNNIARTPQNYYYKYVRGKSDEIEFDEGSSLFVT